MMIAAVNAATSPSAQQYSTPSLYYLRSSNGGEPDLEH